MLTFRELSEKKSKVKINPKQADLTEKDKKNKEVSCESVDLTEEWINASIEVSADYFFAEGINEDGLDQIIDEVGLEDFVDFVIDPIEELNEERSARKASVKAPSYEKVKAAVDKTDAAKKKAGKGEYSKSYAKRSGETEDSTDYKEKAPAKKKAKPVAKATVRKPKAAPKKKAATVKKVEKAVKTAKKTQPKKPTSKKGLLGKVGDAVKKGVERHNKARAAGREPEKRVKEFAKGFKKGVTGTVKFAKKLKKAVSEGNQRDPEGSKKDRTHSKQPDPSKDGFTGIGNMSIKDIMKMNSKIKAKSKKESVEPEDEMVEGVGDAVKKGVKRHKDAVEKKKIKNRKAVPYAALAAEHQPEGEVLDERLGGKGYKSYTSLTGKKISGDWEDSDRGAGNKAKKRAGGKVGKKSPTYLAHVHNKEEVQVDEAKVDQGRSDYGKASIRNYRRKGPGHGEPAMFDPENKRGKLIDKRREEHKARRGVKGAKVPAYKVEELEIDEGKKKGLWDNIHAKRKRGEKPAKPGDKDYPETLNVESLKQARKNVGADKCWDGYKAKGTKKKGGKVVPNCVKETTSDWRSEVEEGAAWTKKSGKSPSGGLNEKGRKSYERENPGSDLKAPQPEGGSRKKSFCARMGGMKKKLTSSKTANDPDSRINKSLRKWKCNEEGYDRMRDDRLVKYGIGHDGSDRKGPSPRPTGKRPKGDTNYQKEMKKKYGGKLPSAIQVVKDKYKGQIYDGKKKG